MSMKTAPFRFMSRPGDPRSLAPGLQLVPLPMSAECPKKEHFLKASAPYTPSEKTQR